MGDAGSVCDSSPLQIFVGAKKKINDIFVEIKQYICDTVKYMQSIQGVESNKKSDDAVQVEGYIDKVNGYNAKAEAIHKVLKRDQMKVSFFGRTSSGKSSVINAMLQGKILPTGFGHTTNCFVQVEGSDSGEPYLVIEGSTERQNVEAVKQLAHALRKEKLGESQLVHIYWPKDKCLLLRDDVVFVDSPGDDTSHIFDELIDSYCLDADVFVFVVNAISNLALAEKGFFHKVSERLSKPNIFILYNYWDVVASQPDDLDQVRKQHMDRAVEFLATELNVCTQAEANQRVFFVSAKEALQARLQEQRVLPADSGALADGFPDRYFEFQDFQRKFEKCISNSAVGKKFERHSESGKNIVSEIQQIMNSTNQLAQHLKTQKDAAKKSLELKQKTEKVNLERIGAAVAVTAVTAAATVAAQATSGAAAGVALAPTAIAAATSAAVMVPTFGAAAAVVGVFYVGNYVFKRLKRNNEAKEMELPSLVEDVNDMDAGIKTLDNKIKQLEEAANTAKVLQSKADDIAKQLKLFDDECLKLHN